MKPQYLELIATTVAGIPCQIGVTDFDKDSCDWEIVDRKGYRAAWLESKLTLKDECNITEQVYNYYADVAEDARAAAWDAARGYL